MEKLKQITNEVKNPDKLLETGFGFSLSREHIKKFEIEYLDMMKNNNEDLKDLVGY